MDRTITGLVVNAQNRMRIQPSWLPLETPNVRSVSFHRWEAIASDYSSRAPLCEMVIKLPTISGDTRHVIDMEVTTSE